MRESTSGVAARPPLIWLHVLFCTYFGHPFLVNHNKLIRYFFTVSSSAKKDARGEKHARDNTVLYCLLMCQLKLGT